MLTPWPWGGLERDADEAFDTLTMIKGDQNKIDLISIVLSLNYLPYKSI